MDLLYAELTQRLSYHPDIRVISAVVLHSELEMRAPAS